MAKPSLPPTLPVAQPAASGVLPPGTFCVVVSEIKGAEPTFPLPEDEHRIVLTAPDAAGGNEKRLELLTRHQVTGVDASATLLHPDDYAKLTDPSGLKISYYSWKDTTRKVFGGGKALLFWVTLLTFAAAALTLIGLFQLPNPTSGITTVQADALVRAASPQSTESRAAVACLEQLAGVNVGAKEVNGVSCAASTSKFNLTLTGGLVTFLVAVLTLVAALRKNYGFQSEGR